MDGCSLARCTCSCAEASEQGASQHCGIRDHPPNGEMLKNQAAAGGELPWRQNNTAALVLPAAQRFWSEQHTDPGAACGKQGATQGKGHHHSGGNRCRGASGGGCLTAECNLIQLTPVCQGACCGGKGGIMDCRIHSAKI